MQKVGSSVLALFFSIVVLFIMVGLTGCIPGFDRSFTVKEIQVPENQVSLIRHYLSGELSPLKSVNKVVIAEFSVGFLQSYEKSLLDDEDQAPFQFSDTELQQAADILYAVFTQKLSASGIEIVPLDSLRNRSSFQNLEGKSESFLYTFPPDGSRRRFKLFPASGFMATGGGGGIYGAGEANNSLIEARNLKLYKQLLNDFEVDAVLVVHLLAGFTTDLQIALLSNRPQGAAQLVKAYISPEISGQKMTKELRSIANLRRDFTLIDLPVYKNNQQLSFQVYVNTLSGLFEVLVNSVVVNIRFK